MKRKLLSLSLVLLLGLSLLLPVCAETLSDGTAFFTKDATLIKSGYLGETVQFAKKDFKQALGTGKISMITVTSLPKAQTGSLLLASSRVSEGDTIPFSALDLLKFVPASKEVTESDFSFTAGNLAGGAQILCQIRLLDKQNAAPTVSGSSLSVSTQADISYYGNLEATDADGDTLYFRITKYPKHGTLTVLDHETGSFRYTPESEYTGKDSFSYVARDEYGHFSTENTVAVKVKKRVSSLVYADLCNERSELAAISLTDAGIMLGRLSGDGLYFEPEKTVSRGDFTVMAMKVAGISPCTAAFDTCFDDNDKIAVSIRPYIATAQAMGIVRGSFDGTGLYFDAERPITRAEAAVILCHALQIPTEQEMAVLAQGGDIPVWAQAEVGALSTLGALSQSTENSVLSRGEVAELLYCFLEK